MSTRIFSTYSTGENRVTASIMAVLKSLSLGRIERLLGALLEQSEFELVRFQNQPSRGGASVPDAVIASSCRLYVETKIKPGTVWADQLKHHLMQLDEAGEATRLLLVLTPDNSAPSDLSVSEACRWMAPRSRTCGVHQFGAHSGKPHRTGEHECGRHADRADACGCAAKTRSPTESAKRRRVMSDAANVRDAIIECFRARGGGQLSIRETSAWIEKHYPGRW